MPYCEKCGAKISGDMTFCPQCGAALPKGAVPPERYRSEKAEKQEKHEKQEKDEKTEKGEPEKYEKREYGIVGPLIFGIILILVGFMFYLVTTGVLEARSIFPFVLVIIGAIVIVGAVIGVTMARGRHPKT